MHHWQHHLSSGGGWAHTWLRNLDSSADCSFSFIHSLLKQMRVKYFFSGIFASSLLVLLNMPDVISANDSAASKQEGTPFNTKRFLSGAYKFVGGILGDRFAKDNDAVSRHL